MEFNGSGNHLWKIPFCSNEGTNFRMVCSTDDFFIHPWGNMLGVAKIQKILDGFWVGCLKENLSNVVEQATNVGIRDDSFVGTVEFICQCQCIMGHILGMAPQNLLSFGNRSQILQASDGVNQVANSP